MEELGKAIAGIKLLFATDNQLICQKDSFKQ